MAFAFCFANFLFVKCSNIGIDFSIGFGGKASDTLVYCICLGYQGLRENK